MFDGGGLLEGIAMVRTPLLAVPQELPPRPGACGSDAVWQLLCQCFKFDPAERPSFAEVAQGMGAARQQQHVLGAKDDWL